MDFFKFEDIEKFLTNQVSGYEVDESGNDKNMSIENKNNTNTVKQHLKRSFLL